jgi:hypothetical protein
MALLAATQGRLYFQGGSVAAKTGNAGRLSGRRGRKGPREKLLRHERVVVWLQVSR